MRRRIKRRATRQRRAIVEELKKVKTHPEACAIFRMVKKRIPSISFGTVYRNLRVLRDEGEILELPCGRHSSRYDGTAEPHYHFFCLKCERVYDLDGPLSKPFDEQISRTLDSEVKYHLTNFYGYCKKCKTKGR